MEAGAPSVDSPGELTNQNPLTLSGSAEASATIQIRGGADAVVETTATGDGSFEVSVPLRADAENTLLVSQVVDGAESPATQVVVTHDGMPPSAPDVDPPASPTRLTMVTLRGSTEAGATVTVTGGLEDVSGAADDSGSFSLDVELTTSARNELGAGREPGDMDSRLVGEEVDRGERNDLAGDANTGGFLAGLMGLLRGIAGTTHTASERDEEKERRRS